MADANGESKGAPGADAKPKGMSNRTDRLIRIALVVILLLTVIAALRWRALATELDRAVLLYNDYEYEQAVERLAPLLHKPLAVIRIRGEARRILLLCEAALAGEERTVEGYRKALDFLEEARKAGVGDDEIDPRVREYSEYKAKLEGTAPPAPGGAEE